jgi:hypothetical protein
MSQSSKMMYRIIVLLNFILLFSYCNKSNHSTENKYNSQTSIIKEQKRTLENKKINSINKIITEPLKIADHIIFLYRRSDCSNCIKEGYQIIKKIDSIPGIQICTIASSSKIERDQDRYNYQKPIYTDEHDIIRKELNFIYTPVLIRLNSDNKIKSLFYPGKENEKKERNFVNKLIAN